MPRQQLVLQRKMHQFDGAAALQFAKHVSAVDVDRFVAKFELIGNSLDAFALDQQIKHFSLTRGQRRQHVGILLTATQRLDRVGAQIMAPQSDRAHRLHQLLGAAAFGQVAAGTAIEGALHERRGIVNTEDNGAKRRPLLAQTLEQAQTVFIRHRHVQHHHVDVIGEQRRPGLRRRAVLTCHRDIVLQPQQLGKPRTYNHVVVYQSHFNH
jgi:hypothetical protein